MDSSGGDRFGQRRGAVALLMVNGLPADWSVVSSRGRFHTNRGQGFKFRVEIVLNPRILWETN